MLLYERLTKTFDFLKQRGFKLDITKVTNVCYELTYHSELMKIHFEIEEMEDYFFVKITLSKDGQSYSISSSPNGQQEVDGQTGIGTVYINIYDFAGDIDETGHRSRLEALARKKRPLVLFGRDKVITEILELHRNLLKEAIDNIIPWLYRDEEHLPE